MEQMEMNNNNINKGVNKGSEKLTEKKLRELSKSKLATKVDRTRKKRRRHVNAVAFPVTGLNA
jgi:hypothetical protein